MKAVIEVEHLRKTYGSTVAASDVSFDVVEGEIFGLLGPNGAGKTTTVECLQGLRRPDAGRIRVLGLDPQSEAQALRRRIGSQLQDSALPDRMKVWEALDLFASFAPGASDWRVLMEQWGLADKSKASFSSLSGGQRQRLGIAIVIMKDAPVVIMDEPTSGLDPRGAADFVGTLRELRDEGRAVFMSTHDIFRAKEIADRVGIMKEGHLVMVKTREDLEEEDLEHIYLEYMRA